MCTIPLMVLDGRGLSTTGNFIPPRAISSAYPGTGFSFIRIVNAHADKESAGLPPRAHGAPECDLLAQADSGHGESNDTLCSGRRPGHQVPSRVEPAECPSAAARPRLLHRGAGTPRVPLRSRACVTLRGVEAPLEVASRSRRQAVRSCAAALFLVSKSMRGSRERAVHHFETTSGTSSELPSRWGCAGRLLQPFAPILPTRQSGPTPWTACNPARTQPRRALPRPNDVCSIGMYYGPRSGSRSWRLWWSCGPASRRGTLLGRGVHHGLPRNHPARRLIADRKIAAVGVVEDQRRSRSLGLHHHPVGQGHSDLLRLQQLPDSGLIFDPRACRVPEGIPLAAVSRGEALLHGHLRRIRESPIFADAAVQPLRRGLRRLQRQHLQTVRVDVPPLLLGRLRPFAHARAGG